MASVKIDLPDEQSPDDPYYLQYRFLAELVTIALTPPFDIQTPISSPFPSFKWGRMIQAYLHISTLIPSCYNYLSCIRSAIKISNVLW